LHGRANGAEQVGPLVAGVARRGRPAALGRPDAGQRALLADAGFVLEPDFQWLAPGLLGEGLGYDVGEVFLNASCASGSRLGGVGPDRQAAEAQGGQLLAHGALVHRDAEALANDPLQVHPPPTHHAVGGQVGGQVRPRRAARASRLRAAALRSPAASNSSRVIATTIPIPPLNDGTESQLDSARTSQSNQGMRPLV